MNDTDTKQVQLVIVGSVGLDTVETPHDRQDEILGGSASYACAAASFFTEVGMVGVIGTDFPSSHRTLYEKFSINLDGLQIEEGKTFRWSGVYGENMNHRETLSTHLNVFESFSPELPPVYCQSPYLFLGNISPELQMSVLEQIDNPRFVAADTMNLWIDISTDALLEVIKKVDMLTLNDAEALQLTGKHSLLAAGEELLGHGPRYILIKKGEHGSMLFSQNGIFLTTAFPVDRVRDPTGAGDMFAGGLMGYLASTDNITDETIRNAILYGSVIASFGVERFSLERLEELIEDQIHSRVAHFRRMIDVPF